MVTRPRARLFACVLCLENCAPQTTLLVRASDVPPGQEVRAAVTDHGVLRFRPRTTLRENDIVYEEGEPWAHRAYAHRLLQLSATDLVEVRATAGDVFGPIRVKAKYPDAVGLGWSVLIIGVIASVAVPAAAIASTKQDSWFAPLTNFLAVAGGVCGVAFSLAMGGAITYFGNAPIVTGAAR